MHLCYKLVCDFSCSTYLIFLRCSHVLSLHSCFVQSLTGSCHVNAIEGDTTFLLLRNFSEIRRCLLRIGWLFGNYPGCLQFSFQCMDSYLYLEYVIRWGNHALCVILILCLSKCAIGWEPVWKMSHRETQFTPSSSDSTFVDKKFDILIYLSICTKDLFYSPQ